MSSILQRLLIRSDQHDKAMISADDIELGTETEFDWCLATGILAAAPPATELVCRNCGSSSAEQIVYLAAADGSAVPYLPCAECGPVRIEPERLCRWRLDYTRLWEAIFQSAEFELQLREMIPGRLWRIGQGDWAGLRWDLFGGCRLWQPDTQEILRQFRWTTRSILVVPDRLPLSSTERGPSPLPVVLRDVLRWNDGWELELHPLDKQLHGVAKQLPEGKPRPLRKRATRAALIELLVKLLKEHLEAAIEHARSTSERGMAELLPRPSQRDLAHLAGAAEMAVSRCLRDPAARELRLLWSTAGNLDQLLALSSARAKGRR